MKQNDLARELNISNSYLSEIESGKKSPNMELLKEYSRVFKIPISSLLFFSEQLESEGKLAKSFRVKSSSLLLKMLDWSRTNEKTKA